MAYLCEVELPSGAVIMAEVSATGPTDVSTFKKLRLDNAQRTISEVTSWVVDNVRESLPNAPGKVGVEFGLKLIAKGGTVISALAEVGTEASVTIKLEWAPEETKQAQRT